MGVRYVPVFVCDPCGAAFEKKDELTEVPFGHKKKRYISEMCPECESKFDELMAPFVDSARDADSAMVIDPIIESPREPVAEVEAAPKEPSKPKARKQAELPSGLPPLPSGKRLPDVGAKKPGYYATYKVDRPGQWPVGLRTGNTVNWSRQESQQARAWGATQEPPLPTRGGMVAKALFDAWEDHKHDDRKKMAKQGV